MIGKPITENMKERGNALYRYFRDNGTITKTEVDLQDVEHTLAELSGRVEEIQARMKPLYEFRDKIKFGNP